MIYVLAVTNLGALLVVLYLIRSTSQERRILWASVLQSKGDNDAARRAAGPTHAEAQKAVEQQIAIKKEQIDDSGTFSAQNPFSNKKPLGI